MLGIQSRKLLMTSKWISVEDQCVLVYDADHGVVMGKWFKWKKEDEIEWTDYSCCGFSLEKVTHWMYLPEKPDAKD